MASEEGKDREAFVEAEPRDSSPPDSETSESHEDVDGGSNDDSGQSETEERASAQRAEVDVRGQSSGAFWFAIVPLAGGT